MGRLAWSEKYSVFIPEIDQQHKKLIAILNALDESLIRGTSRAIMKKTMSELFRYTETHFSSEEKLMNEYEYPEKEKHFQKHRELLDKVISWDKNINNDPNAVFNLLNFLESWLREHIGIEDKAYGLYIESIKEEKNSMIFLIML